MAFCSNCGKEVHEKAVACPGCGVPPKIEKKFCPGCGSPTQTNQVVCVKCGIGLPSIAPAQKSTSTVQSNPKSRTTAGILAILLGIFGVHKFYLGYNGPGLAFLLITLLSVIVFCTGVLLTFPISLIEGIIYLSRTDAEFQSTYVEGKKEWF